MPTLGRALLVLEGECENRVALLDSIFSLGIIRLEGAVDRIECFRGRERIYQSLALKSAWTGNVAVIPLLRDMVEKGVWTSGISGVVSNNSVKLLIVIT